QLGREDTAGLWVDLERALRHEVVAAAWGTLTQHAGGAKLVKRQGAAAQREVESGRGAGSQDPQREERRIAGARDADVVARAFLGDGLGLLERGFRGSQEQPAQPILAVADLAAIDLDDVPEDRHRLRAGLDEQEVRRQLAPAAELAVGVDEGLHLL